LIFFVLLVLGSYLTDLTDQFFYGYSSGDGDGSTTLNRMPKVGHSGCSSEPNHFLFSSN